MSTDLDAIRDRLPAHYQDCASQGYGRRIDQCDCTATADVRALVELADANIWATRDVQVRHEHGENIAKAHETERDDPTRLALHPAARAAFTRCADQARDLSPAPEST